MLKFLVKSDNIQVMYLIFMIGLELPFFRFKKIFDFKKPYEGC